MAVIANQKIPRAGHAREALRQKGQFWTPDWVAEAMVAYALSGGSGSLFDPAVGEGAFLRAGAKVARELHCHISLTGTEIDPEALKQGHGSMQDDLTGVQIRDFIMNPPSGPFTAIVANPPYLRHHRLSVELKEHIRNLGAKIIGKSLDGRAGLHIYFLIQALHLLAGNGRLAFIVPADTCEGIFAPALWNWILSNYRLDAVITFEPPASPFPGVDTNALVLLIERSSPRKEFVWARVNEPMPSELKTWVLSKFKGETDTRLKIYNRQIFEALATGLSRPPTTLLPTGPTLGDFAQVMRGVATGANNFFFLKEDEATALGIPDEFLIPAIGRTRDVQSEEITQDTLSALRLAGRPTLLLSLDGRPAGDFPANVRKYIERGEAAGLPQKPLIAQRQPWYKMEVRRAPAFLFAYLGRRNVRFIKNSAGIIPLTGFLCVYPRENTKAFADRLWRVLRDPTTVANLHLVGKSYGSGALKVEPRALERLPLPASVLEEAGLQPQRLLLGEKRASYTTRRKANR